MVKTTSELRRRWLWGPLALLALLVVTCAGLLKMLNLHDSPPPAYDRTVPWSIHSSSPATPGP
jgi:hypothetical protein